MKIKKVCLLFLSLAMSLSLSARKAPGRVMTMTQPDGSIFQAILKGDEYSHIMTTTSGNAILQGGDGFWYYAEFDGQGGRHATSTRVGSVAPSSVLQASAEIPYELLYAHASERKSALPLQSESVFTRINRIYGPAVKGGTVRQKHGIVILAQFSGGTDSYKGKFRYTREDFVKLLTQQGYSVNGAVGCAKEYFDAQFGGTYEFTFDVSDIVTVSKDRKAYGGNDSAGDDSAPEEMIIEACKLADSQIDFSLYDDDADGEVDNVFVFFAGGDEAEGVGDDYIWAHAWYIKDGAGKNLILDGKRINRYACASELQTDDAGKTFYMAPIGTFCHEYTHTFGLPDFYDSDYNYSGGISDATWEILTLMDGGNMNGKGNYPPFYSAVEREYLEIAKPLPLPTGVVKLEAIHKSNVFYRLETDTEGEYFLLECRQATGWDSKIGGSGLLVYHIDQSQNNAGKSDIYRKDLTAEQRWVYNEVNCRPTHQCVDIIEANPSATGNAATRHNRGNYTTSDVFFPYLTYNSLTDIQFWSGAKSDISITGISYSGGVVTMNVIGGGSVQMPPKVSALSAERFQDGAIVSFSSSFAYDGEAHVIYGPTGKEKQSISLKPYGDSKWAMSIDGLSPRTSYDVEVYFEREGVQGESSKVSFMTASFAEDSYPYIHLKSTDRNSDGSFPASAAFPLRVYNAKNVDAVMWYFDNAPAKVGGDCWFRPGKSGELKAEIFYSDGSKDIIIKEIIIR